ncbi:MAG: putative zinc-binding metallopeptidase [Flavobacteriaceae bacterium]|uniref:zinc-binding metallopeptidase family protein n=1 Tax=Mariniflexile sp. TaxID=1979402 RepID=UPI003CB57A9A
MKIFECPNCNAPVFFENTTCQYCNTNLGYNPLLEKFEIPNGSGANAAKYCANHHWGVCNWFVDTNSDYCIACSLNRIVPDRSQVDYFGKWQKLENAKHRLIYQLLKLKLPVKSKMIHDNGVAFDFLSENNDKKAVTGHAHGVVTIILNEADSVNREQIRKQMDEPYRTLIGHFRHEIGHYYWTLLFNDSNMESYRNLFGDERLDYGKALENHYKNGPPNGWHQNFISQYASSHPWEDWAETWAHYLHIMDTLQTANSFGVCFDPEAPYVQQLVVDRCVDPYITHDFQEIFKGSVALTCSSNSLNRSMGLPDIYPFVVPGKVVEKLTFIHNLLKTEIS